MKPFTFRQKMILWKSTTKKMPDLLSGAEYMISAVDKMPDNISDAILEKIYSLEKKRVV